MSKKQTELPDYWSIYKAINFKRFSKNREFLDAKTNTKMSYSFIGSESIGESIFMQVFSGIMWMSPAFLIIVISTLYLPMCHYSLFIGIGFVTAYHFAAMYYLIRGPYIVIEPVKRKGLFSRK